MIPTPITPPEKVLKKFAHLISYKYVLNFVKYVFNIVSGSL
jgi:hypothetical protein